MQCSLQLVTPLAADKATLIKFRVKTLVAMDNDDTLPQQPPLREATPPFVHNAERSLWHSPISPDIEAEAESEPEEPSDSRGPSPQPSFVAPESQLENSSSHPEPTQLSTFQLLGGQEQVQHPLWQPFKETEKTGELQDLRSRVVAMESIIQSQQKKVQELEELIQRERTGRLSLEKTLHDFIGIRKSNSTPTVQVPSIGGLSSPPVYTHHTVHVQ